MSSESIESAWKRLAGVLEAVERSIDEHGEKLDRAEPEVSNWTIGQQFDHLLRATEHNLKAVRLIERGDDERLNSEPRTRAAGGLFSKGSIPRGIAEAPESVQPDSSPKLEELTARLAAVRELEAAFDTSPDHWARVDQKLDHPSLGPLDPEEWLRFAEIHTAHHLEIIRDIAASA